MKKPILAFFLFMSMVCTAMAPPSNVLDIIVDSTPIISYEIGNYKPLIVGMYKYECNGIDTLVNKHEQAYGPLQIRQCLLDDYNKLNHTKYVLTDCFNYELAAKIFLYFTNHDKKGNLIPNKTWEHAAKDWNGSGPKTNNYWKEVKKLI